MSRQQNSRVGTSLETGSMSSVLKPCVPYIKRAEELDKDQTNPDGKTIAYFCRSYAIQKALQIRKDQPASQAEIEAFVIPLLEETEGELYEEKRISIASHPHAQPSVILSLPSSIYVIFYFPRTNLFIYNETSCEDTTSRHSSHGRQEYL